MQQAISASAATPPAAYTLPAPVGAALSLLPAYPGSMLLVAAINLALAVGTSALVKLLLTFMS